jgi:hypothetical protein
VRLEPGFTKARFTGKTVAQWMVDLQRHRPADAGKFAGWYEALIKSGMEPVPRIPRVPENHYCAELDHPPLLAVLPWMIRRTGLKRASAEQWGATLRSLTQKGCRPEELEESGVLVRLARYDASTVLTQAQVLRLIDLTHVTPKFACEARFGFVTRAGWTECCARIPEKEFRRRGLLGRGSYGALYVIRFRHRSLGWSIARCRFRDLLTKRSDWWWVLNEKGRRLDQPVEGFESPEAAMDFAERRMGDAFAAWRRDQPLAKWERFALPGSDSYREILIQLDDWPEHYQPRHFRTRNVLAHVRTSTRTTVDGRRVLYLDEVQSDWHADLRAEAASEPAGERDLPPPAAPFRNEWPLLAMKLMLWWAQRLGVDGLAWSTADIQRERWRSYGPPEALYRTILPAAARSLAKALGLELSLTALAVRTRSRVVELAPQGWLVRSVDGPPLTKPFRTRTQAEQFADETGQFTVNEVPVLWTDAMAPLRAVPLYGTAGAEFWLGGEPQ